MTFTSGCWQLSHRRSSAWDSHAAACMSGWRPALQLLAFKEHPLGPPVTVLLNKHGTAHHHQWAQMKSSPRKGTPVRGLLSICFVNLDPFTGLKCAILIVTSSLPACFKALLWKRSLDFHKAPRSPKVMRSDSPEKDALKMCLGEIGSG